MYGECVGKRLGCPDNAFKRVMEAFFAFTEGFEHLGAENVLKGCLFGGSEKKQLEGDGKFLELENMSKTAGVHFIFLIFDIA